jgi:transposase-like protein
VRVKGCWKYLYRAIDKDGATLDFYLADRRNAKAAKRFLSAALKRSRDWIPRVINTDKNPAYGEALRQLKRYDPDVEAIDKRSVSSKKRGNSVTYVRRQVNELVQAQKFNLADVR